MKRLIAVFIMAGFVAATGIAQQAPAPQQQHVSHGDTASVNSAVQSDSTSKGTTASNENSKAKDSKKAKKKQKEPVKQTQPQ